MTSRAMNGSAAAGGVETKLTVEKLRKHLYQTSTCPFWQRDFANLQIGLEAEFIISRIGDPDALMKKADYIRLVRYLARHRGYALLPASETKALRAHKEADGGHICVEPDYAYHILEISFPRMRTLSGIAALLARVYEEIDAALMTLGFERSDRSTLEDRRADFDLVSLHRLDGANEIAAAHGGALPLFPAHIAATHVHLNISAEEDLPRLALMYELEWLAVRQFTHRKNGGPTPQSIGSKAALYQENWSGLNLVAVPIIPPRTLADYVESYNRSEMMFPNDPFFPVRDLSFIRPTPFGSVEFRSADTFLEIERILDIVSFRIFQTLYAAVYADNPLHPPHTWQRMSLNRHAEAFVGREALSKQEVEVLERCRFIEREFADLLGQDVCYGGFPVELGALTEERA